MCTEVDKNVPLQHKKSDTFSMQACFELFIEV